MRKIMLALVIAGLAVGAPATAGAATVKGVVISKSAAQGQLAIAAPNGKVTTLRTPKLFSPGTVVSASAFALRDGTFASGKLRVLGHVKRTSFQGILVKSAGTSSFFKAGRSLVLVHTSSRTIASAVASPSLQPGEAADIDVTITPTGSLDAGQVTPTPAVGDDANEVRLQVTVTALTPATATTAGSLTILVNGQTLVIPLPAGTVLPAGIALNAIVNLKIEFRQPNADNRDNDDNDQGDDDDVAVGTQVTTTPTGGGTITGSTTTTTITTTQSGDDHHGSDDGGSSGRDGGGHH
jgi:hypothetical protein